MDYLTFTSTLIDTLTWPLFWLCVLIIFRGVISDAISRISQFKFKYKEAEINFKRDFQETIDTAKDSEEIVIDDIAKPDENELASLSPRGAILEGWLEIEKSLLAFNKSRGISNSRPGEVLQILDHDVLSKNVIALIRKLRETRNSAVHLTDAEISPKSAEYYRTISKQVIHAIEMVT